MFAQIVRRCIAPAWAVWERSPYLVHYRRLVQTQYHSLETILCRQTRQMRDLLEHAYATSPFWRRRFQEINFSPREFRSMEDLRQIPLLTKDDLRNHRDALISESFDRNSLQSAQASGSTGVPVEVFYDEATLQYRRACTLRSDEWSGWRLGERVGAIWGNAATRVSRQQLAWIPP